MLNNYFLNKNYTALYLHNFFHQISSRLIEIFSGVFLYSLGLPLPLVLLFFGLEFGLRGAVAPLALTLVSKHGVWKAIAISYIFLLAFFIMIGLGHVSLYLGFFSFIFQSLARGIYYPCIDTLRSILVKDGTRGRQITLELVWTALAGVLAVGIGASVLANNFILTAVALAGTLILSTLPLLFVEKEGLSSQTQFADGYRYLASAAFRENLLPFAGQSLVIIANVLVAPLFLYTLVEKNSSFTWIVLVGILIEMVLTMLYGRLIDKQGNKKTLVWASALQGAGNVGYIFIQAGSAFLPVLTGLNNTAWNMFRSNYNTRIHQKAKKSRSPLIFSTAVQMNLCFAEIIVLTGFALVAWQWGAAVFVVIFLCSIVGLFVSTKYFVD
jgi:hypothetical protein